MALLLLSLTAYISPKDPLPTFGPTMKLLKVDPCLSIIKNDRKRSSRFSGKKRRDFILEMEIKENMEYLIKEAPKQPLDMVKKSILKKDKKVDVKNIVINSNFFNGLSIYVDLPQNNEREIVETNLKNVGAKITKNQMNTDFIISDKISKPKTQGKRLLSTVGLSDKVITISQIPWVSPENQVPLKNYVVVSSPNSRPLFKDVTKYPTLTICKLPGNCFISPFSNNLLDFVNNNQLNQNFENFYKKSNNNNGKNNKDVMIKRYCPFCKEHFVISDEDHRNGLKHQNKIHQASTFKIFDLLIEKFSCKLN